MIKVTAICPTTPDRAWCLPLALEALGAQRGRLEIEVVVGFDADHFMRSHERPSLLCGRPGRTVGYPPTLTLGEKRMRLVEQARGDFIAFWDDDDWKSPEHLVLAVSALEAEGADVFGVPCAYFYDLEHDRAYLYDGQAVGTTLVIRRRVLSMVEIPARDRGEDAMFLRACRDQGLKVIAPIVDATCWPVAFQHGQTTGRTWPPVTPEYRQVEPAAVRVMMGKTLDRWCEAYRSRRQADRT